MSATAPFFAESALEQRLTGYDYDLPETLIAQTPVVPRDQSRLLVVNPQDHCHCIFRDLPNLLKPGDLLVLNNTRVIPARLMGRKVNPTDPATPGLPVEVLLLEPHPNDCWLALVKPGRRLKPGAKIVFGPSDNPILEAVVLATEPTTRGRLLQFQTQVDAPLTDLLYQWGEIPFPPYLTESTADPGQYQTVYGDCPGAIAAPTAGLHFTPELLATLKHRGITQAYLTLHVGLGTFRPVESERITDHQMHAEWLDVPAETVAAITTTQARGGRVIAVGTTVVRALESAAHNGKLAAFSGKTNLFIYPGYQWQVVDGLITNFHLPRSSLLMLVSALIGRQRLLTLYEVAIAHRYRFYSFGDAMLIQPQSTLRHQQRDKAVG